MNWYCPKNWRLAPVRFETIGTCKYTGAGRSDIYWITIYQREGDEINEKFRQH